LRSTPGRRVPTPGISRRGKARATARRIRHALLATLAIRQAELFIDSTGLLA
jgi:hypothetical protein